MFSSLYDSQCEDVESRDSTECSLPRLVLYEKQSLDKSDYKIVKHSDECLDLCNLDETCIAFVYNENKKCYLHDKISSLSGNDETVTYILKCCADALPVAWKNDSDCRYVASKKEECSENEKKSWEIRYNMFYNDLILSMSANDIECRLKCLLHPKCTIAVYNNSNMCVLAQKYQAKKLYPWDGFQLALLSCCKKVPVKYHTSVVIKSTGTGELFSHIKRKSNGTCSKPVYKKYSNYDSKYFNMILYRNVNLSECLTFCNEQFHCILFSLNEKGDCFLKHVFMELSSLDDTSVYILSCAPAMVDSKCSFCPTIVNRSIECESTKTTAWRVNPYFFMKPSIKTLNVPSVEDCRLACVICHSCVAISYNTNFSQKCNLHNSSSVPHYDKNSTVASFICDAINQTQSDDKMTNLSTVKIISQFQSLVCERIKWRKNSTCHNHTKWVKYRKQTLKLVDLFNGKKVETLKDCLNLCNREINCLAFVYNRKKYCFLNKNVSELKDDENADTYTLECCAEELPVALQSDSDCEHVTSKKSIDCKKDETLSWEVQYETGYHDFLSEEVATNRKCLAFCYLHPNCTVASYEYSVKCRLNDVYKSNRQFINGKWELAILSCCKKVLIKYKTTKIIDSTVSGDLCPNIEKKSLKTCLEPVYLKYANKYCDVGDTIVVFANVTLNKCIQQCNEQFYCVMFNYWHTESVCYLKDKMRKVNDNVNYDLYILSCCPEIFDTGCLGCSAIENRTAKCESTESVTWRVSPLYTTTSPVTKRLTSSIEDCRYACLQSPACVAVSYIRAERICNLHNSATQFNENESFELFTLICYPKTLDTIKTKRIIQQADCFGNKCKHFDYRGGRCFLAVWMKIPQTESKYASIRIEKNLFFQECLELCIEYKACIIFSYSDEDGECNLKYRLEKNLSLYPSYKHDLYFLMCYNGTMFSSSYNEGSAGYDCCPMTSAYPQCEADYVPAYKIVNGFVSHKTFYSKNMKRSMDDCNNGCAIFSNCIATSYDQVNQLCAYNDEIRRSAVENNVLSILTCCTKIKFNKVYINGQECSSSPCNFHIYGETTFELNVILDGHPQANNVWLTGCSNFYFSIIDPQNIWITAKHKYDANASCPIDMHLIQGKNQGKIQFNLSFK